VSSKASTDAGALDFCLERRSAFSFACRACGRCCSGKIIMAGPHEVLGMSRHLGIGTTEFLARHSANGGTTLRFGEDGRCVFVTPEGCRVHPRRPLVCRLYPLGRATDRAGGETFALFPKQDGCEAEFGEDGTIAEFLDSQGVAPYLEWSRRYGEVYRRMLALLDRLEIQGKIETGEEVRRESGEPGPGPDPEGGAGNGAGRTPISAWQDIDASLAAYCAAKGIAAPAGIGEAIDLHIKAMEEWLDGLETGLGPGPGGPAGGEGQGARDKGARET
jgi:Fe-S-cluster containining protein